MSKKLKKELEEENGKMRELLEFIFPLVQDLIMHDMAAQSDQNLRDWHQKASVILKEGK